MTTGVSPANSRRAAKTSREQAPTDQFVCPYCGAVNDTPEGNCPHCTMENTPAARNATKARIGPWYVLQKRNPAAPGMKFETLLSFVHKGRVKAHSIVRGPTTHQLWRFAAQVKGLSREFGLCYSCGSPLATTATVCPQCNRTQSFLSQPDVFLETVDAESAPLVYREVSATDASSANPAQTTMQNANPDLPETDPSRDPPATEGSASEHDVLDPTLSAEQHDMVIPSLAEEAVVPDARPTNARDRLAQARRLRALNGDSLESDDANPDIVDDSRPHPPGQVGPTFVPGARPAPISIKRRTWVEGSIFVFILLAALGSGLMYVDPRLQNVVEGWVNTGLSAVGVHFNTKELDASLPPEAEPQPAQTKAPVPAPLSVSITNPPVPAPAHPIVSRPPAPIPAARPTPAVTPTVQAPPPAPVVATPPQQAVTAPAPVAPAAPVDIDTHPSATPPTPPVNVAPQPTATPPAVEAPAPAPQPSPSSPSDSSDEDPFTRARALRRRGIDAENSGDYAKAVALFEQIRELPRESWPGDLELRLRAAKANLDGKPRH